MIEFVLSLLISLFFFILLMWIIAKITIEHNLTYSFKIKSTLIVFIVPTLLIVFFISINNSLFLIVTGYGVGMLIAYAVDRFYFDQQIVKRLGIRSRMTFQDPKEVFNQNRKKVQNDGEKTS